MPQDAQEIPVYVQSGFGYHHRKPFVTLVIDEKMSQMSPDEARRIAGLLLECAEAAETDGWIVTFFGERLGLDEHAVLSMLRDFRQMRAAQQEQKG